MGLGDTEQCVAAPAVAVGGERRLARVWAGKEWKSGFLGLERSWRQQFGAQETAKRSKARAQQCGSGVAAAGRRCLQSPPALSVVLPRGGRWMRRHSSGQEDERLTDCGERCCANVSH